jgi:hypothetical protein
MPGASIVFVVPTFLVVHAIVLTSDGEVVAARRARGLAFHPGRWSASFEEGVEERDSGGDDDLIRACTLRGLRVEFGLAREDVADCRVRLLSAIVEEKLLNPALVVIVDLPIPARALTSTTPNVEEVAENGVSTIALTPIALTAWRADFEGNPDAWHPTARYRLFMAACRNIGEAEAIRLLIE